MGQFAGVYIASAEAKDLFITNTAVNHDPHIGYSVYKQTKDDGQVLNVNRFTNSLDKSLELTKLREVYEKEFRRTRGFSEVHDGKDYCTLVMNVTFELNNKDWNRLSTKTYVRYGYVVRNLHFNDCIAMEDDRVVAVRVDTVVENPVTPEMLGKYFAYDAESQTYKQIHQFETLHRIVDLRTYLYEHGFYCDGQHFVRWKRSSGSSRVGKCLFINERLYKRMHEWELCGLTVKQDDEIDLAAFEAYISLTLSSIEDTIPIKKENILVMDDYESKFAEDVVVTSVREGRLFTQEENSEITNSIWDGQSLADISLFGKYSQYGMILLRNRFFKSACFNCNLQQWFADNGITSVEQLNGFTLAKDISEVKLVTTPSSIKYLKFGSLQQWFDNLEEDFGMVKHDKPTRYFDGRMVQMHYQLLNSLQLSYDDVRELVQPDLDYMHQIKHNVAVLRHHLHNPSVIDYDETSNLTLNDIIFCLLSINTQFYKTKICRDFVKDLLKSYLTHLRCGRVLVDGTYATLFGNPMEMAKHAIGTFDGTSELRKEHVVSPFFADGETIVGSRSPHISFSNVLVVTNSVSENIAKYFNLTREIICINSIGENILNRLSGSDFDSDTVLITNNPVLVRAAVKNKDVFKIPYNNVDAKKVRRAYNNEQKAVLDDRTSVNIIGEDINFSQELNSLYWHQMNSGGTHEENKQIYYDICQLDIMSRIEIDSAKKEFEINNKYELRSMKEKYGEVRSGIGGRPMFFKTLYKIKGYMSVGGVFTKYDAPMDYLNEVLSKHRVSSYTDASLRLSDVFIYDKSLYNRGYPAHLSSIYGELLFLSNAIRNIMNSKESTLYSKIMQRNALTLNVLSGLGRLKLSRHTIATILSSIDHKRYEHIRSNILHLLFKYNKYNLISVFSDNVEELPYIVLNTDGDIHIFNDTYSISVA